jgi:prophage regulatory protein
MNDTERFISTNDVVALTSLSRASIHRKVRAGDMPRPIRISERRTVFRESEIRAWMADKAQAA